MRAAGQRLKELYATQAGQDVIETLGGAGIAATGQALFTDMTPEEIALSTVGGIGAAAIGRPLVGRAGQALGNRISKHSPNITAGAEDILEAMIKHPNPQLAQGAALKFAPYAHMNAPAQLGQVFGRAYGDNIMQALVALGAPLVMGGQDNA